MTEWHPNDVTLKSTRPHSCYDNKSMTSLVQVKECGRQCMPCSINFPVTLQTEIISTVTSDFLKQMIIRKSFNSVLYLKLHVFKKYCFLT